MNLKGTCKDRWMLDRWLNLSTFRFLLTSIFAQPITIKNHKQNTQKCSYTQHISHTSATSIKSASCRIPGIFHVLHCNRFTLNRDIRSDTFLRIFNENSSNLARLGRLKTRCQCIPTSVLRDFVQVLYFM